VPLAAHAITLRLVGDGVERAKIRGNLTIELRHVLQLVDLVQPTSRTVSQRLQPGARRSVDARDVRRRIPQQERVALRPHGI